MTEPAPVSAEPRPNPPRPSLQQRWRGLATGLRSLSPARRFQLASLAVLLSGMFSTGWWLGQQIEARVISNIVEVNSLYVESLITPAIQDLSASAVMSERDVAALDRILYGTALGEQLAGLVLWGSGGRVLYSSDRAQIGQSYPVDDDLGAALAGRVTWELTGADDEAHIPAQQRAERLIALYGPVRDVQTGRVIAVAEFYQSFDIIASDIALAQEETWLIVGVATLVMYLLLFGFIQRISATIVEQVAQLTALLEQNAELYERTQRATQRAATTNERVLRRISADLHDGLAQYLGAATLHLGRIAGAITPQSHPQVAPFVERAQNAVSKAIQEARGLATSLGLPELEPMPLEAVITRVVDTHERLTNSEVQVIVHDLPEQASPAIKVTLYRIIQEGLSNAYRHGQGREQRVEVVAEDGVLAVLIADRGPGFALDPAHIDGEHMGIGGMRDRVESLGGTFTVTSVPGYGTMVRALLPFTTEVNND